MRDDLGSYHSIIKATIVMGGATMASILIAIARSKTLAILVGPAGIGLIGFLTSIMATATSIGAMA